MSTIIALERGAQGLTVLGQETGQFFMKSKKGAGSNHGCYLNRVGLKRMFLGTPVDLETWEGCPQCGGIGVDRADE